MHNIFRFNKAFDQAINSSSFTVHELSAKLSLHPSYIYKLRKGKELPSEKLLYKIMKLIEFPKDYSADIDLLDRGIVPIWIRRKLRTDNAFKNDVSEILKSHKIDKTIVNELIRIL